MHVVPDWRDAQNPLLQPPEFKEVLYFLISEEHRSIHSTCPLLVVESPWRKIISKLAQGMNVVTYEDKGSFLSKCTEG